MQGFLENFCILLYVHITDYTLLYYAHYARTVVVVAKAIEAAEVERTCIASIKVAPTYEERVRRIVKDRVRQMP